MFDDLQQLSVGIVTKEVVSGKDSVPEGCWGQSDISVLVFGENEAIFQFLVFHILDKKLIVEVTKLLLLRVGIVLMSQEFIQFLEYLVLETVCLIHIAGNVVDGLSVCWISLTALGDSWIRC